MNSDILCTLLARRLGTEPKKFDVRGQEVVFYDKDEGVNKPIGAPHYSEFDTPENNAIVADVIANYDTLEAEYLTEQEAIAMSGQAKTDLIDIDINSVRSIREWLVTQPDAPQYLVDYEVDAIEQRKKVK